MVKTKVKNSEHVTSMDNIIENMLGDIKYPKDSFPGELYPFKLRVGCIKRRPPRHEFWEYMLDMGRGYVDDILKGSSLRGTKILTLIFPERWMGVAEQRSFMSVLKEHPEVKNLEQVNIITSSPLLINSIRHEQILMISFEDDNDYNG